MFIPGYLRFDLLFSVIKNDWQIGNLIDAPLFRTATNLNVCISEDLYKVGRIVKCNLEHVPAITNMRFTESGRSFERQLK